MTTFPAFREKAAVIEAMWNRGPMDAEKALAQEPAMAATHEATATPEMTALTEEMKTLNLPSTPPTPMPTLAERDPATTDQLLGLIRKCFQSSPMGPFEEAFLEGLIADHPKTLMRWVSDPQDPTMLTLMPLREKLAVIQMQYEQLEERIREQNEPPIPRSPQAPMEAVQTANAHRMQTREMVMAKMQEQLDQAAPLPR